jgi:hypothetical protein
MLPWEIEIEYSIDQGTKPDIARAFTIIRWAYNGDLRPLAWACRQPDRLDDAVLGFLAELIDNDRLRVVPRKRASPKKPETFARDLVASLAYDRADGGSEAAFEKIADMMGMSHQSVRQAVTRWRKGKKAK